MDRKEFIIKEIFEKYPNVSLIQNDISFEKYLLKTDVIPKEIIGFYSTAFHHAFVTYKSKTVFRAKYLNINSDIDKIHNFFHSQEIKIINK